MAAAKDAETVAAMKAQLTAMAGALRGAAKGGDTPALSFIKGLADECDDALAKAGASADVAEQFDLLAGALGKKDQWLEALANVTAETEARHKKEQEADDLERAKIEEARKPKP
eukprot:TRINITY_DN6766_c0_g1_i2.p1 TRINITY_DN6766_c0_g1~~TRINITY_DN6766_c0_g1_i2.p1  ORF type:complete len:114 (-),score=43.73 TRINITY_DN6766_c0_g1_i2:174-515(-)